MKGLVRLGRLAGLIMVAFVVLVACRQVGEWEQRAPVGESEQTAPVGVSERRAPVSSGFVALAIGGFHSCGLRADGSVLCWGLNEWGELDAPSGSFTAVGAGL